MRRQQSSALPRTSSLDRSRMRLRSPYSPASWSGRSSECDSASTARRDASARNWPYKDSRSRSFHSVFARIACLRWVIQVVTAETKAPTREPSAAAAAVTTVESIAHRLNGLNANGPVRSPQPLRRARHQHGLDRLAALQIRDRFVNLVEAIEADELIEGEQ